MRGPILVLLAFVVLVLVGGVAEAASSYWLTGGGAFSSSLNVSSNGAYTLAGEPVLTTTLLRPTSSCTLYLPLVQR